MTSASVAPTAALVADAIARIEERRVALDLLADQGMAMVERLVAGETVEIAGRKPFESTARAFAVISRAVRLCLALASRLDEELIALLRGGPIPDLAILASETPAAKASTSEQRTTAPAPSSRERIAFAVDAAIEAEVEESETAERMRVYVEEDLIEGEDYDAFLHRPWRVVVQAICADLGLHPDWSTWDNTDGFPAAAARPPTAKPLALRTFPPPESRPETRDTALPPPHLQSGDVPARPPPGSAET